MTQRRNKLHRPVGDFLLTMRERADTLSQGQQRVAAVMLADPDFAVRANVDALAAEIGRSGCFLVGGRR
jgi:DNA-binding MurR/RpiR family transcriptional regulator